MKILTARQSLNTRLIRQVPTGTTAVTLRGLEPSGSHAEQPFVLPAMPAVPEE